MPRTESVKSAVERMIHAVPVRPFAISLENGDRIVVEHPENIAFDPSNESRRADEFYVVSRSVWVFSTFSAVTSVAALDDGELSVNHN